MERDHSIFKGQKLALYVFECVMAFMYLAFSYVLLFTSYFSDGIGESLRLPLGILLGVYGIFRVYRAVSKAFKKKENE